MAELMQTLKKQWVSVMCGIIALAALVLTWVWVGAQRNDLQSQLDKRKATYDSLIALQSKPRHLPIVNPTAPDATPPELGRFPGPRVIEAGVAAMTQVSQQSVGIESKAVQMNEHKLLVPGSLPIPQDAFRFQRTYLQALQVDIPK